MAFKRFRCHQIDQGEKQKAIQIKGTALRVFVFSWQVQNLCGYMCFSAIKRYNA